MSSSGTNPAAGQRPARTDETVSVYVNDLRRRHAAFQRDQTAELKHMSHDALSRMVSEHIVVGQKSGFESHLQGILTAVERDRLHSDAEFTQAWQIFVDLCWIKKQLARAGMILAAIVVLMLVVLAVLWAIPKVAQGPLPQTGPH